MTAKKARSGKPAGKLLRSSSAYNRAQEVGEVYEKRQRLGTGIDSRFLPIPTDCIKVLNDSGANRVSGDVLELVGLQTTAIDPEHLWLTGDTPTAPGQVYCVLRHATPADKFGVGQVSGVCFARVDVLDEDHTHARLKKDSFTLESHWAGPARIFHKPSGTGVKDCIVVLGESIGGGYTAFLAYGDTITARSGDTPGEGTVTLVKRDPTSGDYMNIGTALVYNDTQQTPFSSDIYIQVKVHYITADLLWDVDDCFVA